MKKAIGSKKKFMLTVLILCLLLAGGSQLAWGGQYVGGFYVCHIIGDGSEDNPYRAYVDNYNVNWVMAGQVGRGALVYVSNPTPELENDNKIYKLPKDLDATFDRNDWNALTNRLKAQGLTPNNYDPNLTVREAIIWIGTAYEPGFDINHFYVGL